MDIVEQTLKHWRQSVFVWGETDCLMSVNDYAVSRGGIDAGARFRGMCTDQESAQTIVDNNGGLEGLLDLLGYARIAPEAASRGDIVVIDPRGGESSLAALCTGPGFAARCERSVIEIRRGLVDVTHAWKVV